MAKQLFQRKIARFGLKPDTPDFRDYPYVRQQGPNLAIPAAGFDLRPKYGAIRDQGQLGSCTGFGISGVCDFLHDRVSSPLWLYYQERKIEGTVSQDSGAEIRDGIKVVATLGLPLETDYPYNIKLFKKTPPTAVTAKAATESLVSEYQRAGMEVSGGGTGDLVGDILDALASGLPVVVGITLYSSFESAAVAKTGKVSMPKKSEQVLGGHCVQVVGIQPDGTWIMRNQWSDTWGDKGYFYLPHAYLANPNLVSDCWVILKD